MTKIRAWLKGKKTYIGLIAATLYAILVQAGVLPNEEAIWGLILLWTGVSFRAAISG
jgi:hypothetical protein